MTGHAWASASAIGWSRSTHTRSRPPTTSRACSARIPPTGAAADRASSSHAAASNGASSPSSNRSRSHRTRHDQSELTFDVFLSDIDTLPNDRPDTVPHTAIGRYFPLLFGSGPPSRSGHRRAHGRSRREVATLFDDGRSGTRPWHGLVCCRPALGNRKSSRRRAACGQVRSYRGHIPGVGGGDQAGESAPESRLSGVLA